jgi:hypothetical protein
LEILFAVQAANGRYRKWPVIDLAVSDLAFEESYQVATGTDGHINGVPDTASAAIRFVAGIIGMSKKKL